MRFEGQAGDLRAFTIDIIQREASASTKAFGTESLNADDAYRSMATGVIQPSLDPQTIHRRRPLASLDDLTFPIVQEWCAGIITVSKESIIDINASRL